MFTALRLRAPIKSIKSIRQFSSTSPAMKILYIGNMSFNIKEDELRSTFEEFGEVVSAKIITDRLSGRPRGFAFVELVEDSASDLAIEQMNGKEIDGRALVVNESTPREPREQGSYVPRGGDRGDRRSTGSYGDRRGGGGGFGSSGGRGGGYGGGDRDRRPARGSREDY